MTQVTISSELLSQLKPPLSEVEVYDEAGNVIGYFRPAVRTAKIVDGKVVSPYSDAEIEELRRLAKEKPCRPLKEFWADLERR